MKKNSYRIVITTVLIKMFQTVINYICFVSGFHENLMIFK